jgi:hypothetical protein
MCSSSVNSLDAQPLPLAVGDQVTTPLIPDVLSLICSHGDFLPLFGSCRQVCKGWNAALPSMKRIIHDYFAFSPQKWAMHIGKELSDEEKGAAYKMLPDKILEILVSPCPASPPDSKKRVVDTHVLVYIGTELSLSTLGKLAEKYLPQKGRAREVAGYEHIYSRILAGLDKPVEKPYWVLMTKDVLGGEDRVNGSRRKSYPEQQNMVRELSTSSETEYHVPKTLEAVAVIIARFLKDKTYLFSKNPGTYTRCEEEIESWQIVVGGFAPAGLRVNDDCYDRGSVGVAGLRKFGSWS